jgi:hypothetical protein
MTVDRIAIHLAQPACERLGDRQSSKPLICQSTDAVVGRHLEDDLGRGTLNGVESSVGIEAGASQADRQQAGGSITLSA